MTYYNVVYHEVFFHSVYFVRNIVDVFGKTTTKEFIIDMDLIMCFDEFFWFALVRGLFDSEGCFYIDKRSDRRGNLSFSTTKKKGVESLAFLLSKMGFMFNINKSWRKGFYEYRLRTSRFSVIKRFYEEIGFGVDYKQQRLKEFMELRNKRLLS